MRIQHNIMAMSAYRNYTNNVSAMKKNLEKLSSGYKINRAGDDAAGLAISEKMRAQITGLETAQKNAKDGISLVQTAEGALTEVHDMLNRMVELATQSANGTYDDQTDRAQMQKELDQLRSEINRIADSSNFNGIKLLNGEMSGAGSLGDLQNVNVTATNDGQQASKATQKGEYTLDLGQVTVKATAAANIDVTLTVGGQSILTATGVSITCTESGKEFNLGAILTAGDFASSITADTGHVFKVSYANGVVTLTGEEDPTTEFTISMTAALGFTSGTGNQGEDLAVHVNEVRQKGEDTKLAQGQFTLTADMVKNGNQITIGDTTYTFQVGKGNTATGPNVIDLTKFTDGDLLKEAANALSKLGKANDKFDITADGQTGTVYLTEKAGAVDYKSDWDLKGKDNTAGQTSDASWKNTDTSESAVRWAAVGAAEGKSLTLQIGDTAESFNQLKVDIQDMHCDSLGIDGISIADQASAQAAVDKIKAAINKVSDVRGTLGATQNRLDHTINNLSVMTENIQDAESTIRDVDVAEEMMAYTKNNILIQSAQAMLAQANQVPQGVLQLLQ